MPAAPTATQANRGGSPCWNAAMVSTENTTNSPWGTSTMRVTVNGDGQEVPDGTTVRGLIELLQLGGGPVVLSGSKVMIETALLVKLGSSLTMGS